MIESSSTQLLKRALDTIPVSPECSNLTFLASGVLPVEHFRMITPEAEAERVRYIDECRSKGIVPFTTLDFEWNDVREMLTPGNMQRDYWRGNSSEVANLFHGGRMHRIRFSSVRGRQFSHLVEAFNILSMEDYQPVDANLALTTHHETGYNQGDYADMQLMFASFRDGTRKLTLRGNASDKVDDTMFREWFAGLSA